MDNSLDAALKRQRSFAGRPAYIGYDKNGTIQTSLFPADDPRSPFSAEARAEPPPSFAETDITNVSEIKGDPLESFAISERPAGERAVDASSTEVQAMMPSLGADGRPDPSYMESRANLPLEQQKKIFEAEAFQAAGVSLGFPIAVLATLPDLISLPPLIAAGMITADEGKKLEGVLNMLQYVPSAMIGKVLTDQGQSLGLNKDQIDAFGQGYLGGELSSIIVNAVPGAAKLVQGAKWLKGKAGEYAAGAPERIAERGEGVTLTSGIDPQAALDDVIVGFNNTDLPAATQIVSSRLPTAKAATEDPLTTRLQVGIESAKADEKAFNKNLAVIKTYPNIKSTDPTQAADELVLHVKDNLLYLYDAVPVPTRGRSKQWYVGARKIVDGLAVEYKLPDQSVAGVMAVLSPQKDWFMNVSLGKRVIDIHVNKANEPWTNEMMTTANQIFKKDQYAPILQGIAGKSYSELETAGEKAMWLRIYDETYNPRQHNIISPEGDTQAVRLTGKGEIYKTGWGSLSEIAKAVNVLDNPDLANISFQLGSQHKVRSFYNNMYSPMDKAGDVTIDTHAVAAGLLRPLSGKSIEVTHNFGGTGIANSSVTGNKGTYALYAEAYRQAAKERGVLPREMQSITWEAVRGLFNPQYKGQASNVQYIDNIWAQYKSGDITIEEARNAVVEHAGRISAPEWERSGGAVAPKVQDASNSGELDGAIVPRPKPTRPGSRRNGGNPGNNQTKQVTPESPNSGMGGDQ
tara:strand:+ start:203 stop:2440 length:2238 start_codon:yes stop_codon:yes gene_type:complete